MTAAAHQESFSSHVPPIPSGPLATTPSHKRPTQVSLCLPNTHQGVPLDLPNKIHGRMLSEQTGQTTTPASMAFGQSQEAACCTDQELRSYTDLGKPTLTAIANTSTTAEFDTVTRIIELYFSISKRGTLKSDSYKRGPSSREPSPLKLTSGSIVDKLTMIKAYQQSLRNMGTMPVEDSRIYKLLFHVIGVCERYVDEHKHTANSQEMAQLERQSLLLNQLHHLRCQGKQGFVGPNFPTISHVTQPTFDFSAEEESKYKQETRQHKLQSQPYLEPPVIDTISQIGAAENTGVFRTRPTSVNSDQKEPTVVKEESSIEGTNTAANTYRITKLDLKSNIKQAISSSETNPCSDRQIANEIVSMHVLQDCYPSFDRHDVKHGGYSVELMNESLQTFPFNQTQPGTNDILQHTQELPTKPEPVHLACNLPPVPTSEQKDSKTAPSGSSYPYFHSETDSRYSARFNLARQLQMTDKDSSLYVNTNKQTEVDQIGHHSFQVESGDRIILPTGGPTYINTTLTNPNTSTGQYSATNTPHMGPGPQGQSQRAKNLKPPIDRDATLSLKLRINYKTILSVFRAWHKQVERSKMQKRLKKQLLRGLVQAIEKHEELLVRKAFRGFRESRLKRLEMNKRMASVKQMVELNTAAFYFRLMIKKYKERVFGRGLARVAGDHFQSTFKRKLLKQWQRVAKERKAKLVQVQSLLKRKPQALLVLIRYAGFHLMPVAQQTSFDVLDFYSYCTIKKRMKPDGQRFARSVEIALKAQLKRLLTAWKNQKHAFVNLRRQQQLNLKRRVFRALDRHCTLSYRLGLFVQERERKVLERVVIAFLQNQERRRRLQLSSQMVQNLHRGGLTKLMFRQWHELYSFYKIGSLARFNDKSEPLKALHFFRKRVFKRLKHYWEYKRSIKAAIRIQQRRHGRNILTRALISLLEHKHKSRNMKRRALQVSSKQDSKLRSLFFKGMKRACMLRQRQRAYREYVLMAKGLQALARRVDYKRMLANMNHICEQTYVNNLAKRVFKAFRARQDQRGFDRDLLGKAKLYLAQRSKQVLFHLWRQYSDQKRQRGLLGHEVVKFQEKKVLRRVFRKIVFATQRRKDLRMCSQQIGRKVELRLYRQVMVQLICKYAKRVNLKHISTSFKERRDLRIQAALFGQWLGLYSSLKIRERHVAKRHSLLTKSRFLSLWYTLAREQGTHNVKVHKILALTFAQTKSAVFASWKQYAHERQERRKMTDVSRYFFICKVLRRTIGALRMHAIEQKFNKARTGQQGHRVLADCFEALRVNAVTGRKVKEFQLAVMSRKVAAAVEMWRDFVVIRRHQKEICGYFNDKRDSVILRKVFGALRGPSSDKSRLFRQSKLLHAWCSQAKRQLTLQENYTRVSYVHNKILKHTFLQHWRQSLFFSFAVHKIATPFNSTMLLKRAFYGLKRLTRIKVQARAFHKHHLLCKAMSAFSFYQIRECKVKAMQRKVQMRTLDSTFDAFIDKCLELQDLRLKGEDLKRRADEFTRLQFFRHWRAMYEEQGLLQPIQAKIETAVRTKWLMRAGWTALSRYTRIRQGKKQMYDGIVQYRRQMSTEKAFRQLVAYANHRQNKQGMTREADQMYQRSQLRKCVGYALRVKAEKEGAADEQREHWLMIKTMSAMRDYTTLSQEKRGKQMTADAFCTIRLKVNVFRSLAIYYLRREAARSSYLSKRQVRVSLKTRTAVKAARIAGLQPKKFTKGLIKKQRALKICSWRTSQNIKAVAKLQAIRKAILEGKQTKLKASLKARKRSKAAGKPKKAKRVFIKRSNTQRVASPAKMVVKESPMVMVMEEMVFMEEEEEASMQQREQSSQELVVVNSQRVKIADKAGGRISTDHLGQKGLSLEDLRSRRTLTNSNQTSSGKQVLSSQVNPPSTDSSRKAAETRQPSRMTLEIEDLKRDSMDNSLEQMVQIEECYAQQEMPHHERNDTGFFNGVESQGIREMHWQMESLGMQLTSAVPKDPSVEDVGKSSLSYMEEKYDNVFYRQDDSRNGLSQGRNSLDQQEEQLHTMPSFRELPDNEEEHEKTLSAIYDDVSQTYIAQEPSGYQQEYITRVRENKGNHYGGSLLNSSVQFMTEKTYKVELAHRTIAESPQYETRKRDLGTFSGKEDSRMQTLQVSQQEIDDELRMYSSVQSYQKQRKNFAQNSSSDCLKRLIQNRLNQSGRAGAVRASGGFQSPFNRHQPAALNQSVLSGRSHSESQPRVRNSSQKDNKVMQQIVENLSYLSLSKQNK